jgi:hypothetical protein
MKMKFLSWFNLTTLSNYSEIEERAKDYKKLISTLSLAVSELTLALEHYESKPKPEVEFKDFKNDVYGERYSAEKFDEWYSIYQRNQYAAYKIRLLSNHPHLLIAFLNEFSSFDWEKVRSHMHKTKWFWGRKKESPTIDELKDCVITLIPENDFDNQLNAISSGGFTVSLYYDENKNAVCKINFENLY